VADSVLFLCAAATFLGDIRTRTATMSNPTGAEFRSP
jgi:hypothetical protein